MGAFYTNLCVRAPLSALPLVDRACALEAGDWTVLVGEQLEGIGAATLWAQELTTVNKAVALVVDVHDSDILQLNLVEAGDLVESYDSYPNYFSDDEERTPPMGMPAEVLTGTLRVAADLERVEQVLRFAAGVDDADDPYLFEENRHAELFDALGLPRASVGASWEYVVDEPEQYPGFVVVTP